VAYDPTSDYLLEVAQGNIDGRSSVLKFGRNEDVDSGIPEDIWDGGGLWVPPTAARTHDVDSTSGQDDNSPGGTGARTIEIQGLDANFDIQSETVVMNGLSNVATANTYTRIFRMKVLTAGANGGNVGTIRATAQVDGTLTAAMSPGYNQTLMAIYTVPDSHTAYMYRYYGSINRRASAAMNLELRVSTWDGAAYEPRQLKHVQGMHSQGGSFLNGIFEIPLRITERSDIIMRADVGSNNMDISAGFDLVLVDD